MASCGEGLQIFGGLNLGDWAMKRKLLSCLTLPLLLLLGSSSGNSTPQSGESVPQGFNPGPDIITGDIGQFGGLEQFGSEGTQVGLAVSTTSCNLGDQVVNFFALLDTRHPVIPHNLYRMSGGSGNDERFEQIGQSWMKHAFGADQSSDCATCQPGGDFNHLGVGCSDTYANFQNAEPTDLGSRALINPFTGVFQSTANNHNGHVHTGTSHRILVEGSDLNTTLNAGATYYAEVQYISSDEYAWCQTHPGQCNMYNNASYRRYNVSGTTSFTFSQVGNAVRMLAAVNAWPGATINPIEPEPGVDGRAYIAYKVTNPSAGVWHYEYALYNENLDRAIQSFSVPLGCAITLSNLGFHAPLNHPGYPNDGTLGGAGFSNAPWSSNQTADAMSWSSETFAQNQNANAIRWGTLYNFRFDSSKPPVPTFATIGFFKTGAPVTVAILGPNACDGIPSPTPSATPPNPTPTTTPGPTSPTPTVTPAATPTPTPTPAAQALNLSTRMRVQTGENVGIAGFIIMGTAPKHILIRAIGPSINGVPGLLADPVLDLYRGADSTLTNDNWRDDPVQEAAIIATGIPPTNNLEAAIDATLNPGSYTAIIRGKNNTSGIALVEVYDLSPAVMAKLANISTRAFVSTGSDIVIAGFILGGNSGNDRLIVRGIGPSIVCKGGCLTLLQNPTLEIRDHNGALLVANNDWQDDPAQAAEITAAGLAPRNNLEAAIATSLSPGLYTALLAGQNSGTGLGLVEVYDRGNATTTPNPTPTLPPPPTSPSPSPTVPSSTPSPTPGTPTPTATQFPSPSPTSSPIVEPCVQNFDSVAAPALPPGWSGSWITSTIDPDSAPNDAFVPDPATVSDASLFSPFFAINSPTAQLFFRNNFNTEHDPPPAEIFWDGYVLEVSTDGGTSYNDIIAAGGVFVSGAYTGEIDSSSFNPLAGRMAWSGDSGGYINTVINLPASFNGQTIKLKFRMGTDGSGAAPGVRIDGVGFTGATCP
jgi:hypothetical protein